MHHDSDNIAYTVKERDTAVMDVCLNYPSLTKDVPLIDYDLTPRARQLLLCKR